MLIFAINIIKYAYSKKSLILCQVNKSFGHKYASILVVRTILH